MTEAEARRDYYRAIAEMQSAVARAGRSGRYDTRNLYEEMARAVRGLVTQAGLGQYLPRGR